MGSESQPSLTEGLSKAQMAALIQASKLLNSTLDRDRVLRRLMDLAAQGVDADRATLYLLDGARQELWAIVALGDGVQEIRLPLGEGLAGHVARTGETVNVADAYDDPRFNRQVDKETGYRTRSVLTVPMRDPQGQIGGVVQVINKQRGLFSAADEHYLLALSELAALALENARLHAALAADYERLSFLYRISSLMTGKDSSGEVRLRDVLLTVMDGVTGVIQAEASSILLWDQRRRRLVFVAITGEAERELTEVDVPLKGSIAGWVILNEEAVLINDVQNDPRFFSGADKKTGFVTRNMVCAPMKVGDKVIGVLQVLNKAGGGLFDEADLKLLQAVADHAALAINSARHYESLLRVGEHSRRQATAGIFNPMNPLR